MTGSFSFMLPALFLSFLISTHPANGQNLINEMCETFASENPNIEYNFCTTSLQAAPASQCASLKGLGKISIRLVRYNVTDTLCYIKRLLNNTIWDPYSEKRLDDCFELFSDAISSVKQAMRYYNSKQYDDANRQITTVMTAATTCEDGFNEIEGLVSPLTERNRNTFHLSAVVLSVIRAIQRGSKSADV